MTERKNIAENSKGKKSSYLYKQRHSERWTYFVYSIFMGLVFIALYMNREVKASKNLLAHHALTDISLAIKKTSPTTPSVEYYQENSVKEKTKVIVPSAVNSLPIINSDSVPYFNHNNTSQDYSMPKPVVGEKSEEKTRDSLKAIKTLSKSNRVVYVRRSSIQQTEIMIPCYADKASLKMYQDKLLQSGIRLDMTDIVYGTTDKKGVIINNNEIAYCQANVYLADTLFKSVQLNNFKEFRIKWDTYNTGEVNIKSISMLDKNYMLKRF